MAVYKLNESSNKAKNHTKLSERYLQEGPGAGYTVEGEIDRVVSINSFKVVDKEYEGEYTPYDSDEPVEYYTIGIECDVDILLNNVSIESYYYGGLIESSIPAKLNYISLGGVDGNTKITKDMLDSAINCINSFEVINALGQYTKRSCKHPFGYRRWTNPRPTFKVLAGNL